MFNYFSSISNSTIHLVYVNYYIILIFIAIVLMFISIKLITSYEYYILEKLIMHYVRKILFFLNNKYDRDTSLYKEVYNITHTKIDKYINIFYYFSIFYLCCKTFLLFEFRTNNFKDEITEQVLVFCIASIF